MGKIVAIGGGENGRPGTAYETGPFDDEIAALTGKARPRLLFLGHANTMEEGYFGVMEGIYEKRYGAVCEMLSTQDLQSTEICADKIARADIVYVGGGNTRRMMLRWRAAGVDALLRQAYERGAVLSGVSAGGICWCDSGNSDSLKFTSGSPKLIRVRGLGLVPVLFCPHYDAEPLRQTDLPRMMKTVYKMPALAMDNGTALEVTDAGWRILQSLPGALARKCRWRGGAWVMETLPADGVFRPMKALLK